MESHHLKSDLNMSLKTYMGKNYTEIILKLNYERMLFQLPVIVFLTTIMAVSLIGNILVVSVYRTTFKKRTSSYFIMILAIMDLCGCMCIPFDIFDLANPYMHPAPVFCAINRFLEAWTSTGSGLVLVCIAFDRYFHVCNPMGIYSIQQAQSLTIVMLAVAVGVSWPIIFLAGKRTIPTPIPGVYGEDCSYKDEVYNSIYTLLFQGGLLFAFFVNFWIFGVFYARIFYTIYKRSRTSIGENVYIIKTKKPKAKYKHRFKRRLYNKPNQSSFTINSHNATVPNHENPDITLTNYAIYPHKQQRTNGHILNNIVNRNYITGIGNVDSKSFVVNVPIPNKNDSKSIEIVYDEDVKPFSVSNKNNCKMPIVSNKTEAKPLPVSDAGNSHVHPALEKTESKLVPISESKLKVHLDNGNCNQNVPVKIPSKTGRTNQSTLKIRTTRTTIILAIVTLTAVLGFLPYLVVSLLNNFGNHFQYGMPAAEDLLFEFCAKSYFLNCAANPIIYSVMNPTFRHDSAMVLKKMTGIFRRK